MRHAVRADRVCHDFDGKVYVDWTADCGACDWGLDAGHWEDAYGALYGHVALSHPSECDHEFGWHPYGRPEEHKCLECGTALDADGKAA